MTINTVSRMAAQTTTTTTINQTLGPGVEGGVVVAVTCVLAGGVVVPPVGVTTGVVDVGTIVAGGVGETVADGEGETVGVGEGEGDGDGVGVITVNRVK